MGLKPEEDLATYIDANTSLVLGTNLFHGPPKPPGDNIPHEAVFVFPSGGPAPSAFNGETTALRESALQIRIRGDKEDNKFKNGLILSRAVRDAVHYASIANYIDVRVEETDPVYLGEDDAGHPEWTVTASMNFEE